MKELEHQGSWDGLWVNCTCGARFLTWDIWDQHWQQATDG